MKIRIISLSVLVMIVFIAATSVSQNIVAGRQGFAMQMQLDNRGVFGRYAFPGGPTSTESMGFEYPIGQKIEHLYGAGLWVGGKLDTARAGTSTAISLVTVAYEGWSGPMNEFYPGYSLADSIWKVIGRGIVRPSSWESYWGNSIPRVSVSDNDFYMCYNDTGRLITGHVPLRLKVVQSSFVWADTMWEGIQIVEYKVINQGRKTIDSAFVGCNVEGDVGYRDWSTFWTKNCSGYSSSARTCYTENPVVPGTTPIGLSLLKASRPLDSLRVSVRYSNPQTPSNDANRYRFVSTGQIDPDEYPGLSDSRFLLSCGPFTIRPIADTVVVAFAFVSGQSINQLDLRAQKARQLYTTFARPDVLGMASEAIRNRR